MSLDVRSLDALVSEDLVRVLEGLDAQPRPVVTETEIGLRFDHTDPVLDSWPALCAWLSREPYTSTDAVLSIVEVLQDRGDDSPDLSQWCLKYIRATIHALSVETPTPGLDRRQACRRVSKFARRQQSYWRSMAVEVERFAADDLSTVRATHQRADAWDAVADALEAPEWSTYRIHSLTPRPEYQDGTRPVRLPEDSPMTSLDAEPVRLLRIPRDPAASGPRRRKNPGVPRTKEP